MSASTDYLSSTPVLICNKLINNLPEISDSHLWDGATIVTPYLGGKGMGLLRLGGSTRGWMGINTSVFQERVLNELSIKELRDKLGSCSDESLESLCKNIQNEIMNMSDQSALFTMYRKYLDPYHEVNLWAVRSSAVDEDGSNSMAGLHDSVLNVTPGNMSEAIKKVWASAFSYRATAFRRAKNIDPSSPMMAVIIQYMNETKISGVLLTEDPLGQLDKNYMIIESVMGLGESLVSGEVTPQLTVINSAGAVIEAIPSTQSKWINPKTNKMEDMKGITRVELNEQQIVQLHHKIIQLRNLGAVGPLDIEWCIGTKMFDYPVLLQVRPLFVAPRVIKGLEGKVVPKGIIVGTGVSAGVAEGFGSYKDESAPILLAEKTSPDYLPRMLKSKGIITESGGLTCHAAMVSRELGIPCIVGVGSQLFKKANNKVITMDGTTGFIKVLP